MAALRSDRALKTDPIEISGWKLFMLFIVVVISISAGRAFLSAVTGAAVGNPDSDISCALRQGGCGAGETFVYALSDPSDSHIFTTDRKQENPYSMCCVSGSGELSAQCGGSDFAQPFLLAYSPDDGHVLLPGLTTTIPNPTPICLSSRTSKLTCRMESSGSQCGASEACLGAVADTSDSHIAACGSGFRNKICCQAALLKYSPDRFGRGFCPRSTDCLWNPRGSPEKSYQPDMYFSSKNDPLGQPACLADGQYILDYLCAGGSWTSRSKALALEMIDAAQAQSPDDYSLFCGDYKDALNFVDYDPQTLGAGSLKGFIEAGCMRDGAVVPCVNNFCVMRVGGVKTSFGTSLNIPIDDPDRSFLKALGLDQTSCNSAAIDDGRFHDCSPQAWYASLWQSILSLFVSNPGPKQTLMYNHGLQSIISSTSSSTPTGAAMLAPPVSKPVLKMSGEVQITQPMVNLRSFVETPSRAPFRDPLANISLFSNLFILHGPNRYYFGVLERDVFFSEFIDVTAMAYDGVAVVDPATQKTFCDFLADRLNPQNLKGYDCAYDSANGRMRMVAIARTPASGGSGTPLRDYWRDMTSKIR